MSVIVVGYGVIPHQECTEKEKKEIEKKGIAIYNYLRHAIEPVHNRRLIYIDVETKDYLIGDDTIETRLRGQQRANTHDTFWCRIGDGSLYFEEE